MVAAAVDAAVVVADVRSVADRTQCFSTRQKAAQAAFFVADRNSAQSKSVAIFGITKALDATFNFRPTGFCREVGQEYFDQKNQKRSSIYGPRRHGYSTGIQMT